MRQTLQLTALTLGILLLSGCQVLQSNTARLQAGIRVPEQVPQHDYAEQQLAAGRAALTERNFAAAIGALRNAALESEFAAPAHNGLGVAYAGIGRNDLAGRYFRQAIEEDPAMKQYADNLVRLARANFAAEQVRLAQVQAAPAVALPSPAQVFRGSASRASLEAAPSRGRIERLSATGVLVRSTAPLPAIPRPATALPRVVALRPGELPVLASAMPNREPERAKPAEHTAVKPETPLAPSRLIVIPVARAGDAPQVAITTTGRRYPTTEFARIFAPYSGRSEAPLVAQASVSAAGLRPLHAPEPAFGHAAPASVASSLALADQ